MFAFGAEGGEDAEPSITTALPDVLVGESDRVRLKFSEASLSTVDLVFAYWKWDSCGGTYSSCMLPDFEMERFNANDIMIKTPIDVIDPRLIVEKFILVIW